MKTKSNIQIEQLKNATERLAEAVELEPTQVTKDASIQRFEFTFELAWKIMKSIAYDKGMKVVSPKDSIRTATQLELIDDVMLWFSFLESRNVSSHIYNEEMADDVYNQIKKFLPEVRKLIQKIEEKNNPLLPVK